MPIRVALLALGKCVRFASSGCQFAHSLRPSGTVIGGQVSRVPNVRYRCPVIASAPNRINERYERAWPSPPITPLT